MIDKKKELHPPMYRRKEFVEEYDYANINLVLMIDIDVKK